MSYTFENELIDTMEREYLYDTKEEVYCSPSLGNGYHIVDLEEYAEEEYLDDYSAK